MRTVILKVTLFMLTSASIFLVYTSSSPIFPLFKNKAENVATADLELKAWPCTNFLWHSNYSNIFLMSLILVETVYYCTSIKVTLGNIELWKSIGLSYIINYLKLFPNAGKNIFEVILWLPEEMRRKWTRLK